MSNTARMMVGQILVAAMVCATGNVEAQSEKPGSSSKSKPVYKLIPPPANYSPPQILIPGAIYDWGTVIQGEVIEHKFRVQNQGGSTLRIERVKPSCGCTTSDYTKAIEPGEFGEITLVVETKNLRSNPKNKRPQTKTAQIFSNASKTPEKLTIKGFVDPAFTMEPEHPSIEVVKGIDVPPTTVTLRRASDRPIHIKSVTVKPAAGASPTGPGAIDPEEIVSVDLNEVESGSIYEVKIKPQLPDDTARRYYSANLEAALEVGDKAFNIPIRIPIRVKDRIAATPPSVFFPRKETESLKAEGAAPISKEVTIKTLDPNHNFKITGIEVKEPSIQTSVETVVEGKEYRVLVTLAEYPKVQKSTLIERLQVHTDDPKIPTVQVHTRVSLPYKNTNRANLLQKGQTGPRPTVPDVLKNKLKASPPAKAPPTSK